MGVASSAQTDPPPALVLIVDPSWEVAFRIEVRPIRPNGANHPKYELRVREYLGSSRIPPHPASARRTDTNACPAALAVLQQLEALPAAVPDLPDYGREEEMIVVDGTGFTLEGRAIHLGGQSGRFRIESNHGSPLGNWAESLLASLAPCWSSFEPSPPAPPPAAR